MSRPSNRETILTEGLKVVHAHGYAGASVRDIVQAAGVPQGSFTNHFASKEAFGLEIIERYFEGTKEGLAATLRNDDLPPMARFETFIDCNIDRLKQCNQHNGCLYGNFAAETCDQSEAIRLRLAAIFTEIRGALTYCLQAAVTVGELPPTAACDDLAGFILDALQGAQLMGKVQRDVTAVERLKRVVFSTLLR